MGNSVDKTFKCQEMFRHGCTFCECADMAEKKQMHETADIGFYISPVVVNSAFACEVFLKALWEYHSLQPKKTHALNELFDALPVDLQNWIRDYTFQHCGEWNSTLMVNVRYIDLYAKAFEDWRYSYEQRGARLVSISFVRELRNALREACCELFFGQNWDELSTGK